jgi:hypothetical protein
MVQGQNYLDTMAADSSVAGAVIVNYEDKGIGRISI